MPTGIYDRSKSKPRPLHSEKTKTKMSKIRKKWHQKHGYVGSKNPRWKGGKKIGQGYIFIYQPSHPFCNCKKYIKRSRLVMEKTIGRYLRPKEVVHHKNEIRDDDRPENLKLFANQREHKLFHDKPKNK